MVIHDDHSYCDECRKHSIDCWCFCWRTPAQEGYRADEICIVPDDHPVEETQPK